MRFESAARRLADTLYTTNVAGSVLQLNLPKEGIFRSLNIELHGSITTTFASGSPAAPAESTIDTIISQVTIEVNGRVVKSVRPHMLHMLELIMFGQEGKRSSSAAAAAVTGNLPTVDGGFVFGTTTQTSTVREALRIPFEMEVARSGFEKTWLNLNGVSTATVKFITAGWAGLDTTGAPVTYAGAGFTIEAYLDEVIGANPAGKFADFQQIWGQDTVTAAATDRRYDLATGNFIAGILLYVKKGSSPSVAADLGLTTIKIQTGNKIIKQVDWNAEQAKNRQTFGIVDKRVSNLARFDGSMYISLLSNNRDLNSAFDARGLNSVQMVYSTHASATYSLTVNVEQHIIVTPQ